PEPGPERGGGGGKDKPPPPGGGRGLGEGGAGRAANSRTRCVTATTPSATPLNASQPACEWNPPSATSRDSQVPTAIRAAMRTALANQMAAVAAGSTSSAAGERS